MKQSTIDKIGKFSFLCLSAILFLAAVMLTAN